ncbi:MAG: NUDIX domain-containing protein [Acidimicrobiia bacterium]
MGDSPDDGSVRERLFPDARGFTIRELRKLCAHLPKPELRRLQHDVDEPTLAATAVPIVDVDGEAAVVIVRRSATVENNPGTWVFPVGRVDRKDATMAAAAVRNAAEQLNVPRDGVELLGQLDTHGPVLNGFLVSTFVIEPPEGVTFAPPPRLVSEVAVVPLAHFMAEGRFGDRNLPDGGTMASFALPNGELLWGLQAEILLDLLERLVRDRVDHPT